MQIVDDPLTLAAIRLWRALAFFARRLGGISFSDARGARHAGPVFEALPTRIATTWEDKRGHDDKG